MIGPDADRFRPFSQGFETKIIDFERYSEGFKALRGRFGLVLAAREVSDEQTQSVPVHTAMVDPVANLIAKDVPESTLLPRAWSRDLVAAAPRQGGASSHGVGACFEAETI